MSNASNKGDATNAIDDVSENEESDAVGGVSV
jgi:hypothetical protein